MEKHHIWSCVFGSLAAKASLFSLASRFGWWFKMGFYCFFIKNSRLLLQKAMLWELMGVNNGKDYTTKTMS